MLFSKSCPSKILIVCVAALLTSAVSTMSTPAFSETVVTTYVTKVQEERKSTRWTLTEWLKIKERMKMMDVWLAMFSSPKKDSFNPELNIEYSLVRGNIGVKGAGGRENYGSISGNQTRAQFWMTNLVTAATGLKTLNIDFGVEAYGKQMGSYSQSSEKTVASFAIPGQEQELTTESIDENRESEAKYYSANFRIFGKSIQDSSLVLKYGQYVNETSIPNLEADQPTKSVKGTMRGADLNLYLFSFLGFEGNYMQYGNAADANQPDGYFGTYYDYGAFIEVSLLRFTLGNYKETGIYSIKDEEVTTEETGVIGGLKLQF